MFPLKHIAIIRGYAQKAYLVYIYIFYIDIYQ
jgi:hypothetical protein